MYNLDVNVDLTIGIVLIVFANKVSRYHATKVIEFPHMNIFLDKTYT